jgi:putative transposase
VPGTGGRYPLSGLRVGRELDAIIAQRGKPAACVSDNCTELTSTAILRWSGKPPQNAFVESFNAFNGRLRDELLNKTLSTRSPMPERSWTE